MNWPWWRKPTPSVGPVVIAYGGQGGTNGSGGAGGMAIIRKYGDKYVATATTTNVYNNLIHHDPDEDCCPRNHEPMDCECESIKKARAAERERIWIEVVEISPEMFTRGRVLDVIDPTGGKR